MTNGLWESQPRLDLCPNLQFSQLTIHNTARSRKSKTLEETLQKLRKLSFTSYRQWDMSDTLYSSLSYLSFFPRILSILLRFLVYQNTALFSTFLRPPSVRPPSQAWHINFSRYFDGLYHENHIFSECISSRLVVLATLTTWTTQTTWTTWVTLITWINWTT